MHTFEQLETMSQSDRDKAEQTAKTNLESIRTKRWQQIARIMFYEREYQRELTGDAQS